VKICSFFHGCLIQDKVVLKVTDEKDLITLRKLFKSKSEREQRTEKEILLECEIDAAFQKRTFRQLRAVFKLVTVIFQSDSENHRKPTEEEKYSLYLDLLGLYADKIPNRYTGELRSIHISEANTMAGSHFIDGLMFHVTTLCNLPNDLQATVRSVLYEWEIWRGKQEHDVNDDRTISEMREYLVYSEASGRTPVHFHHIVSRGACPAAIEKAWNILALTPDEHNFFHQQCKTWEEFFDVYPHLRGRVEMAYRKCNELVQRNNEIGIISMADMDSAIEDIDSNDSLAAMALAAQGN
jgi:hypothetical protein